jgi:hypothetical protein
MAFKDITTYLYPDKDGNATIKLDYKDKAHRYYAYPRVDVSKAVDDKKAWGKCIFPKGTTTLLGDTLEKKGLMKYAMTKALMDLFGFYEFTGDDGSKRVGYSDKGAQRLWGEDGKLKPLTKDEALDVISFGSKASDRHTKKGADIGTVVHDAIEHYIKNMPFDIAEQYTWNIKEAEFETEADETLAWENFDEDVKCASQAFLQFKFWWDTTGPTLFGAEETLFAMNIIHKPGDTSCTTRDMNENCHCMDICGTYDGDIGIQAQYHPVFAEQGQEIIRVTADWKTSNASKSEQAAMPEGIGYTYFIQNAIYEKMRRAQGKAPADDLLVVSCRKDGGFSLIYASELGLTVGDCIAWADSVIICCYLMNKTKKALWDHQPNKPEKKSRAKAKPADNTVKEAF